MRGWRLNSSRWIDMRLPSSNLLRFTDWSEEDDRNSMGLTDEARSPNCHFYLYGSASWISCRLRPLARSL